MTVSGERRLDEMGSVLAQMAKALGDEQLLHRFYIDDRMFEGIRPTTWVELAQRGFIERQRESGPVCYKLTPPGWIVGLKLSGLFDSPELLERAQRLVQALKAIIKENNRASHYDAAIDVRELAQQTSLPIGWVFNVFASDLLQERFDDKMMNAYLDPRSNLLVLIPSTFGQRRLD